MASFGLNTRFLLRTVLKFAGFGALIVAIFSLYITPWAEGLLDELKKKMAMEADITGIMAGRFKEFGEGDNVLYVEDTSRDQKSMKNVFLQTNQDKKLGVLTSDSARFEVEEKSGDRFVVFSAGRRYSGTPGLLDYSVTEYQKYGVRLDFNDRDKTAQARHAAPTVTLWKLSDKVSVAELQWRFSMPLQAIILALAAVMLVKASSERGRFAGLLSAILIYFVYSNLLGIARNLVRKGALPTYLGPWWVHALLLALILFLYFYPALRRWRLSRP
jgi:lipopolysaccharide export system permease protein